MKITRPTLGIIGGGQLGSMLAIAAKKINIETVILSDQVDAPGKNFCDKFIYTKYNNNLKIKKFLKNCDVITYEFENIPYDTLRKLNKVKKVIPSPIINKIIQNRFTEKKFINNLNIKTTKFSLINNLKNVSQNKNLLPGILKTCALGYDGKGQYKINSLKKIKKLKINFNNKYILEKFINLKKEISILITRFKNGKYVIYEPIENNHKNQILIRSKIPAKINSKILKKSKRWTIKIAKKLNYVGTMCVEYFIDKKNNLYVNEIAPRVHNSGHLTINTHNINQFENHVRAVCGLKFIKLKKISNARMINILGSQIVNYRRKKFKKNQFFFDYSKKLIKPKRKMGHLTVLCK